MGLAVGDICLWIGAGFYKIVRIEADSVYPFILERVANNAGQKLRKKKLNSVKPNYLTKVTKEMLQEMRNKVCDKAFEDYARRLKLLEENSAPKI
jgi:hypothetical protein